MSDPPEGGVKIHASSPASYVNPVPVPPPPDAPFSFTVAEGRVVVTCGCCAVAYRPQRAIVSATPERNFDNVITQLLQAIYDPCACSAVNEGSIWVPVPDGLRHEVC